MASLGTGKAKLAVGAIFKNEAPYVLEWIAFHRAVGVERFFVADNASDDGTTELLAGLQRLGLVEHIPFPHVPDGAPQLPAYAEILRRHGHEAEWIAFIDADEFLTPEDPGATVAAALDRLDDDVAVAAVNWAIYGSSHLTTAESDLVISRFSKRAEKSAGTNRHYKAIVRPALIAGIGKNPHSFAVREPFRALHIGGGALVERSDRLSGVTATVDWSAVRINHYVVKSFEEFVFKKRARGRATSLTKQRTRAFFDSHDRNDVADPMDAALVEKTRLEIARLKRLLREAGAPSSVVDADQAIDVLRDMEMPLLEDSPAREPRRKRAGRVGRATLTPDGLELRGWAFDGSRAAERLRFRVGAIEVEPAKIERLRRADLKKRFRAAPLDCGFRIVIDLGALGDEALLEERAALLAFDPPMELKIAPGASWREIVDKALGEAGVENLAGDDLETRKARIAAFLRRTAA